MPEWMTLPDAMEPKLAVFFLLVSVILSLSYFGRRDEPHTKTGRRRGKHRKKLSRVAH
jgi:hypothetical protein